MVAAALSSRDYRQDTDRRTENRWACRGRGRSHGTPDPAVDRARRVGPTSLDLPCWRRRSACFWRRTAADPLTPRPAGAQPMCHQGKLSRRRSRTSPRSLRRWRTSSAPGPTARAAASGRCSPSDVEVRTRGLGSPSREVHDLSGWPRVALVAGQHGVAISDADLDLTANAIEGELYVLHRADRTQIGGQDPAVAAGSGPSPCAESSIAASCTGVLRDLAELPWAPRGHAQPRNPTRTASRTGTSDRRGDGARAVSRRPMKASLRPDPVPPHARLHGVGCAVAIVKGDGHCVADARERIRDGRAGHRWPPRSVVRRPVRRPIELLA